MHIEEYRSSQQEEVAALTDSIFGEGFFEGPGDDWRNPDTLALVAIEDDHVVGFASGRLLPEHGLAGFLDNQIKDVPADIAEADSKGRLGVIEAVAVALEHRGEGIGTKLLRVLHDHIVGYGADKLIVTFRQGPSSSRVKDLMERLGYEFWTSMDSYWKTPGDDGEPGGVERSGVWEIYRAKVY
ncbi:MAG: GNAT family N-acetyltransferase [Pseudomonadota bacterium]